MKPTASAAPASSIPTPERRPENVEAYERVRDLVAALVDKVVAESADPDTTIKRLGDIVADCAMGIDDGLRFGQHEKATAISSFLLAWAVSGTLKGRVGGVSNLILHHTPSKGAAKAIGSVAQSGMHDAIMSISNAARASAQIAAADQVASFGEEGEA